jgi:SAM-dependent methyltransferase
MNTHRDGPEGPDLYDKEEVSTYWKRIHNLAVECFADREDELLPVVADPGTPDWEKRHVARFQRKAVLRSLRLVPDVAGLRGLEFGCGTGRWVRLLSGLGADMVGVDISEDVIERNQKLIPEAEFRCADITKDPPEEESYDLVISITVIQHLPYEEQEEVVRVLGESLKSGGVFLMLENIHDTARTVFPRSIGGWKGLALSHGLECTYSRGYGFDLLPRFGRRVLSFSGFRKKAMAALSNLSPEELAAATYDRYRNTRRHRRYAYVFRPMVAASYVVEPISQSIMPSSWATHCSFVFKKTS